MPEKATIHEDVDAALSQLEDAIKAHITNPIFRDLALHGVEMVRKVVDAHLSI